MRSTRAQDRDNRLNGEHEIRPAFLVRRLGRPDFAAVRR